MHLYLHYPLRLHEVVFKHWGKFLCSRNHILWYVALRRCVNGTGRFDRTRWLQLTRSRGPLKFLDGPLDQSGRRHYIPSKCRSIALRHIPGDKARESPATRIFTVKRRETQKLGRTVVSARGTHSGYELRQIMERRVSQVSLRPSTTPLYCKKKKKTHYHHSENLFSDTVSSTARSNARSICMILTPVLLNRTKAMREGHTSCW